MEKHFFKLVVLSGAVFALLFGAGFAMAAVPTVTRATPGEKTIGSAQFILTVSGTGFTRASVVSFASPAGDKATTYVSVNQLTAVIPASDLTELAIYRIIVTTPGENGGVSAVTDASPRLRVINPRPAITGLSPARAQIGPDFNLTIYGTGFVNNSSVSFANTPIAQTAVTFVSANELTVDMAGILVAPIEARVQPYPVTVTNSNNDGRGGGTSPSARFIVTALNNQLLVMNTYPLLARAGSPNLTITVNGSGFRVGSRVTLSTNTNFSEILQRPLVVPAWSDPIDLTTTFVSSIQLTATIPAVNLTNLGRVSLKVSNPPTQGGSTRVVSQSFIMFPIYNPVPNITSLDPTSAPAVRAADLVVTVNGTGFMNDSIVSMSWNNGRTNLVMPFQYISPTQLSFTITQLQFRIVGSYNVVVSNAMSNVLNNRPTSSSRVLRITPRANNPQPQGLTSIEVKNPASAPTSSPVSTQAQNLATANEPLVDALVLVIRGLVNQSQELRLGVMSRVMIPLLLLSQERQEAIISGVITAINTLEVRQEIRGQLQSLIAGQMGPRTTIIQQIIDGIMVQNVAPISTPVSTLTPATTTTPASGTGNVTTPTPTTTPTPEPTPILAPAPITLNSLESMLKQIASIVDAITNLMQQLKK